MVDSSSLLYCQPFTLDQFQYCDNVDPQILIEYIAAYLKLSVIICDGVLFHFDPGMKLFRPLCIGKQDGTGKQLKTVAKIEYVISDIFNQYAKREIIDNVNPRETRKTDVVLKQWLEEQQGVYPTNGFIMSCIDRTLFEKLFKKQVLIPLLTLQSRMNTDFKAIHFTNGSALAQIRQ